MTDRLRTALDRFFEIHATDPRTLVVGGTPHVWSVRYHTRMLHWLQLLAPDAPDALRLAAACQHIRRWERPRADYPAGRAGYKRWRAELAVFHGDVAAEVLNDAGYDDAVVARVRALLKKLRLRHDADAQALEDVICLVFIENELRGFAAKHPIEKTVDILQKTWAKMSGAGHTAAIEMASTLPDDLGTLLKRAIGAA